MLRFLGPPAAACDGLSRRELLCVGGLSALGLGLPSLLRRSRAASSSSGFGGARSCVLVYLFGGPSQIDLFDLKPDAPAQFRGEFRPIDTAVAGIQICEHLPRLARQAHQFCLIRSMNHEHPRHGWGLYYMLTGRRHNRPDLDAPPTPEDFPGLGALVSRLRDPRRGMPTAVTLPRWNRFLDLPNVYAGEKAGILGPGFDPWLVESGADGASFALQSLDIPVDVPIGRLSERRQWLAEVDHRIARWGEAGQVFDSLHAQAYDLVSSRAVRRALDLSAEAETLRDGYGRHPFGQALLLARRLVEAGTTLVQVNWHNDGSDIKSPFWDTHKDNFTALKDRLAPALDGALAAFLADLEARSLLASTLVLVLGEFGRTPRVGQVVMNAATNASGRDHWPHAYTVLAAGGGVQGGTVYGATDARAAYVTDRPVSPPDLHATVLHALGLDPATRFADRRGKTHRASLGRPVTDLF